MFVVTGGGKGIGKALAEALARRGQSVLIIGRNERCLIETAAASLLITYLCADVATVEGRDCIAARLRDAPAIKGLVHNAGIIDPIASLMSIDATSWHQCMATNLEAPLFLNQLLHDKIVNGRVLTIGSGAAYFPVKGWTAYCVSKAALSMLTRCWQLECTRTAFASVMPGIIDTDMQASIRNAQHMAPDKLDFFKQLKQHNKLIAPETVAVFLSWLLLDIDTALYESKEWDIYDTSHHPSGLIFPHKVPSLD